MAERQFCRLRGSCAGRNDGHFQQAQSSFTLTPALSLQGEGEGKGFQQTAPNLNRQAVWCMICRLPETAQESG